MTASNVGARTGHDRTSGQFSKSRGLSASVSFFSFPPPQSAPSPLFYLRHFISAASDSRSSFFAHTPTETLATQATYSCSTRDNACACSDYFKNGATSATSEDNEVRYSVNNSRAKFNLKLTIKNLLLLRGQIIAFSTLTNNTQTRTNKR